jgi:ABC-type sulfate transport system substrate-binding protein
MSSADLQKRIGLHIIDYYIFSRQLCWIGHVSMMNFNWLPRRMLSCWVPNKRSAGRPRFTYGEAVNKALKSFEFDKDKLYDII